jgi:hypothetical protein
MSLTIPKPATQYDANNEAQARTALAAADAANQKNTQDVNIGLKRRLILTSPNGAQWSITVSNTGTISATAL